MTIDKVASSASEALADVSSGASIAAGGFGVGERDVRDRTEPSLRSRATTSKESS